MTAVKEATNFLAPVLEIEQLRAQKETSLVIRLSKSLSSTDDISAARPLVIRHALNILLKVHDEICEEQNNAASGTRLESPSERRVITALVDLIVLEGIYPSVTEGVGVPIERRARSFIMPSLLARENNRVEEVEEKDRVLLGEIIQGMSSLLQAPSLSAKENPTAGPWARRFKGVEGAVRERCMVDIIAGSGELAFNPEYPEEERKAWKDKFFAVLSGISTSTLMPLLMSLLHPASPAWFRQAVSRYLSLLPITRPHGVRDILELFLTTAASGNPASGAGPKLSTDVLAKASRLISSVPTTVTPTEFFRKVCPQLLDILESTDPNLQRAAAYVIAELLGRRGEEIEKVVNVEIVQHILCKLDPKPIPKPMESPIISANTPSPRTPGNRSSALLDLEKKKPPILAASQKGKLIFEIPEESHESIHPESDDPEGPLVSESELSAALRSLEILLAAHPTPLVSDKLISPVLLSLWDLLCHAKATNRMAWHSRVSAIIKSYFATSLDVSVLNRIRKNLISLGGKGWIYASGSHGGIEIRKALGYPGQGSETINIKLLDTRVEEFFELIGNDSTKSGPLTEFFLDVFRTWVARTDDEDPVKMLISVRMLQEMLGGHAELLAKRPTDILQLIKGVLEEYISYRKQFVSSSTVPFASQPTINSLGHIVPDSIIDDNGPDDNEDPESSRTETCSMALTLLSTLLTNPSTEYTPSDTRLLNTLSPTLSELSSLTPDSALRSLASNLSGMLSIHPALYPSSSDLSAPKSAIQAQRETYQTALAYLRDPLVPVRAHGLTLLRELILSASPIIDITTTTRLLVTMVKDADSFVYLNVVKCLTALTERHSKTVTKMLVAAYVDDEDVLGVKGGSKDAKLGLDERLNIGEALLNTVQRLGNALVGETAEVLANALLGIVSRRRTRPEEKQKPEIQTRNPMPPRNKDDDGQGSDDDDDVDEVDEDGVPLTDQQKEERNIQARIVTSWSSSPAVEDLRIRTSALSILSAALETNALGLGDRIIHESISTAMAILTQETKLETGILRRAAVVCIGAVLRGIVGKNEEEWRVAIWRVVRERAEEMARVLGYVNVTDADGLVREQAGVVGENLRAVLERGVVGGRAVVETAPPLGTTEITPKIQML